MVIGRAVADRTFLDAVIEKLFAVISPLPLPK
jgi:hypothetical protein